MIDILLAMPAFYFYFALVGVLLTAALLTREKRPPLRKRLLPKQGRWRRSGERLGLGWRRWPDPMLQKKPAENLLDPTIVIFQEGDAVYLAKVIYSWEPKPTEGVCR